MANLEAPRYRTLLSLYTVPSKINYASDNSADNASSGTIVTVDQHKHSPHCSSQNVSFFYSIIEENYYLFEDQYLF